MSKIAKNILMPFAAIGMVASYLVFGKVTNNGLPPLQLSVTQNQGAVSFTISNIPAMADINDDGREAQFLVFVNTGDGFYYTDTVLCSSISNGTVTLDGVHYYADISRTYSPYAELTPIYGDDDPPPMLAMLNTGSFTPTTASSNFNGCDFSGWAKIEANRKIVPGDSITYIVTYQNRGGRCQDSVNGDVILKYDTSKITYLGTEKYFGENAFQHTISGNTGILKWSYQGLTSGTQRNIFFRFEANGNIAEGDTLDPTPTLTFTHGNPNYSGGDACAAASESMVHGNSQVIANAHDPNVKTANLTAICKDDRWITYTIQFQNEGSGPADSVVVQDELEYIGIGGPKMIAASHSDVNIERLGDVVRFTFSGTNFSLRGLAEPGYGTKFTESATIGWVKFKVQVPRFTKNKYCGALVNRASIVFNCNPPMWTNTTVVPFKCNSDCGSCTIVRNATIPFKAFSKMGAKMKVPSYPLNPDLVFALTQQYKRFKWYPAAGMGTPDSLAPNILRSRNITYTLVASNSDSCQQAIFHFPVSFDQCDNLKINVEEDGLLPSMCKGQNNGRIRVWATGGEAPYDWHTCGTTLTSSDTAEIASNLAPGKYYVGVTDKNGCTAERWVEVKAPSSPLQVDDDPNDCTANLRVSGGSTPYTYNWVYYYNQTLQHATTKNIELVGTTSPGVTVTDSNGCSVVFKPQATNCQQNSNWQGALWASLGIALAGLGFQFFRSRKKNIQ